MSCALRDGLRWLACTSCRPPAVRRRRAFEGALDESEVVPEFCLPLIPAIVPYLLWREEGVEVRQLTAKQAGRLEAGGCGCGYASVVTCSCCYVRGLRYLLCKLPLLPLEEERLPDRRHSSVERRSDPSLRRAHAFTERGSPSTCYIVRICCYCCCSSSEADTVSSYLLKQAMRCSPTRVDISVIAMLT